MQCMVTKIAQVLVAPTCTFLPLANVRYTRYRAPSRDDCPGDDCETAWKSTQNNLDLRFQSRRSPSILHVWLPWSRIRFVERSIVAVPVGGWFGGHSMSRGGGMCKVCLFSIESSEIGRKILEGAKKHCWGRTLGSVVPVPIQAILYYCIDSKRI